MATVDELTFRMAADIAGLRAGMDSAEAVVKSSTAAMENRFGKLDAAILALAQATQDSSTRMAAALGTLDHRLGTMSSAAATATTATSGLSAAQARAEREAAALGGELLGQVDAARQSTMAAGAAATATREFASAQARAEREADDLTGELVQQTSATGRNTTAVRGNTSATERATGATRAWAGSNDAATRTLNLLRTAIVTLGIQRLVSGVIDASTAFDRINNTMRAATGSAAAAGREYAFVRQEALRLGLDLQTAATQYGQLAAAARGTALAGQATRDIFTAVAQAATVLGLSADQASGAFTAIQQMVSKGNVSAEELRQQLGERLPGAFQIAARAIGVTTAELNDMLDRGELTAEELLPKLARELNKTFGPEVARATQQTAAQINRFKTAMFELQVEFGRSGFIDGFVDGMNELKDTVSDPGFRAGMREFGEFLGNAISVLADNIDLIKVAAAAFAGFRLAGPWGAAAFGAGAALTNMSSGLAAMAGQLDNLKNNLDAARTSHERWQKEAAANPGNEVFSDRTEMAAAEVRALEIQLDHLYTAALMVGEGMQGAAAETEKLGETLDETGDRAGKTKKALELIKDLQIELAGIRAGDEGPDRDIAVALLKAEVDATSDLGKQIASLINQIHAAKNAREQHNKVLADSVNLERQMLLSQEEADAITAIFDEQTKAKLDFNKALEDELELAQEKQRLAGQSERDQEIELRLYAEINKHKKLGIDLDKEAIAQKRAQIAQIVDLDIATRKAQDAADDMRRVFEQAAEGIQDAFAEFFEDVLSGGVDSFEKLADAAKRVMIKAASEIAAALVFKPVVGGVLNAVGLGGGSGGLGDLAGLLGAGSSGGAAGGGGIGDLLGIGSGVNSMLSGGAAWVNNIGGYLGFATNAGSTLAGAEAAAMAGDLAEAAFMSNNAGGIFGGTTLSGFLGGMGIGSGLASLLGLGSGNFMLDTGTGLAGAALGQLLIPIPGVGAGVGAFVGTALGGLFGKKKPSVGPNAYAQTNLADGAFLPWETGADNGADAGPLVDLSAQIGDAFQEILDGLGADLAAGAEASFHLGNFPSQGGIWTMINGGRTPGGERQTFGEDSEAAIADIIMGLFQAVDLEGVSAEMQDAIRTSAGLRTSIEDFVTDLDFLKAYFGDENFLDPEPVTQAEQAIDALNEAFEEAKQKATDLGLELGRLETMREDALGALTEGFDESIAAMILAIEDPLAAALQAFEKAAEQQRKEAEVLGADMVALEKLQALQRAEIIEEYGNAATSGLKQKIDDFILSLLTGDASTVPPEQQLALARQAFDEAAAAAMAGDADAAGNITNLAQALANESRSAFASSQGHTDTLAYIVDVLRAVQEAQTGSASSLSAAGAAALGFGTSSGEAASLAAEIGALAEAQSAANDNAITLSDVALETFRIQVQIRDETVLMRGVMEDMRDMVGELLDENRKLRLRLDQRSQERKAA